MLMEQHKRTNIRNISGQEVAHVLFLAAGVTLIHRVDGMVESFHPQGVGLFLSQWVY